MDTAFFVGLIIIFGVALGIGFICGFNSKTSQDKKVKSEKSNKNNK